LGKRFVQFGQKELVLVGSLVSNASNLIQPAREENTRVQALTAQINLAQMAPAQLKVFIEKQAGECMTPSPSEERNWSQNALAPCSVCTCGVRSKHYSEDDETCASLYLIEVSRTLA